MIDEQRIWVGLAKCDAFGISPVVEEIGPEQFGDIRAGLKPVSTFFFRYEHLLKRLSYIEKQRLKAISENNKSLEVLINQFS